MATRYRAWVPNWLHWVARTRLWRLVLEEFFEPKDYHVDVVMAQADIERGI